MFLGRCEIRHLTLERIREGQRFFLNTLSFYGIFLKENHVFLGALHVPAMLFSNPFHGVNVVKAHVSGISNVVPMDECVIVLLHLCHDAQPAPGTQHAGEPAEFGTGTEKMLRRFRACDEVIRL